jgi:hypothetical protein
VARPAGTIERTVEITYVLLASDEGGKLRRSAMPDAGSWEALKAKAEFQREIYRVADGRVANFDTQVGVIIAAAVAVVGVGAGAATRGKVLPGLLVASFAAAMITGVLALSARQELPWQRLPLLCGMKKAAREAKAAVDEFHGKQQFASAEEAYREIFKTWLALTTSIDTRRDVKRRIYAAAVLWLFVELALVLYLLTTAKPG